MREAGRGEPWIADEGPEEVGHDVDAELDGEDEGEKELELVVDLLCLVRRLGAVVKLQLGLHDIAEKAQEDEDCNKALHQHAAVEAVAFELEKEQEAWPRPVQPEQCFITRGAENSDPSVAGFFVFGVEIVSPPTVVSILFGSYLDDVQITIFVFIFHQRRKFTDFLGCPVLIVAEPRYIVPLAEVKYLRQRNFIPQPFFVFPRQAHKRIS